MSSENTNKAVLFVDVVGSVDLFAATSDVEATNEIQSTLAKWSMSVGDCNGRVVKHLGDGLLCLFDQMQDACSFLSKIKQIPTDSRLSPHAGLHAGEVLIQDNDVFGQAINLAARLASYAAPGEIVASQQAVDAMPERTRTQTRFLTNVTPKGFSNDMPVYQFVCNDPNLTQITATLPPTALVTKRLMLSHNGNAIEISQSDPKFTIGRELSNDLCVDGELISRQHVTIRFDSGNFMLSDHSTNGTWLVRTNGQMRTLMRETRTLRDDGFFTLGHHPDRGLALAVNYRIVSSG